MNKAEDDKERGGALPASAKTITPTRCALLVLAVIVRIYFIFSLAFVFSV